MLVNPPTPKRLTVQGHNDVSINVWDHGGDGPTLLLSHCTGTCARVWDPLALKLIPHFRVLAVDTRGHGDSEKSQDLDTYVWKHSGEDLRAIVAQLNLGDTIYAVGHSSGGAHVTYAQLQQPGLFSNIMLIDPMIAPPDVPLGVDKYAEAARRRRATFDSKAEALERFASKPPMDTWHPDCLNAYVSHGLEDQDDGSVTLKCWPEIEGTIYERGGAQDAFVRLAELDSSTITLVTGDGSYAKMLVEFQYTFLPEASYHEIANVSHFIPQEQPHTVATLIQETFLP